MIELIGLVVLLVVDGDNDWKTATFKIKREEVSSQLLGRSGIVLLLAASTVLLVWFAALRKFLVFMIHPRITVFFTNEIFVYLYCS